jgi:ribosomal protein L37AE/L43A
MAFSTPMVGAGPSIGHDRRMSADDIEHVCPRCAQTTQQRYYGPCASCRAELVAQFAGTARAVEVPVYEPKMNVTPNAVAMRDDD